MWVHGVGLFKIHPNKKKGKSRENVSQEQRAGFRDIYFENRCKSSCKVLKEQAEISRVICTGNNGLDFFRKKGIDLSGILHREQGFELG
jgi:hypothetical protein